jgi:hypothetical protein
MSVAASLRKPAFTRWVSRVRVGLERGSAAPRNLAAAAGGSLAKGGTSTVPHARSGTLRVANS